LIGTAPKLWWKFLSPVVFFYFYRVELHNSNQRVHTMPDAARTRQLFHLDNITTFEQIEPKQHVRFYFPCWVRDIHTMPPSHDSSAPCAVSVDVYVDNGPFAE
jgi:hypothetical protein